MERCVGLAGYPLALTEQEQYERDTRQLWALGITIGVVALLGLAGLVVVWREETQRG